MSVEVQQAAERRDRESDFSERARMVLSETAAKLRAAEEAERARPAARPRGILSLLGFDVHAS